MNYGNIKYLAIEDGVGCRTVLFVSGCTHHCKGCFQPQTWDFNYGQPFTEETEQDIFRSMETNYVDGITILGGEPFEPENQKALLPFLKRFKKLFPEKTIWMYSGYTYEELNDKKARCYAKETKQILKLIDILVDGEFIEERKNLMIPFRGSDNQRIIDIKKSLSEKKIILSEYNERKR